jgi:GNAT superfamily N-acetyltransferase
MPEDLVVVQEIESSTHEQFRALGMTEVAEDPADPLEDLAVYAAGGRCWIAADRSGRQIGYLLVDFVDGAAHIEQVSVRPEHQGRGVGRALLEQAARWAQEHGCPALTLTTFSDVPWNRPLYEHLGFRTMTDADVGPGLGRIKEEEDGRFAAYPRVAMRLEVRAAAVHP